MSFETETATTLGAHGARLDNIEGDIGEIKGDLKKILAAVSTEKGERAQSKRTWGSVLGIVGAAAGVTELIEFVKHLGHR